MSSAVSRPLHLAAEVGGGASVGALVRLAEQGALDFVTVRGGAGGAEAGGRAADGGGGDAVGALAGVVSETVRIGLVPTVTAGRAGPLPVRAAVAALDLASRGRAGWSVDVSTLRRDGWGAAEAREAGGGIRDTSTGRSVDSGQARAADLVGSLLVGAGASATATGAPQDRPVTVVDVSVCGPDGLAVAAHYADVVIVRAFCPAEAGMMRADLRRRAAAAGRDPDSLRILAALTADLAGEPHLDGPPTAEPDPVLLGDDGTARYTGGPVGFAQVLTDWHAADVVDGFHITPVAPGRDLERLVNGTVTLLQHRCLIRHFYAGSTLREHLGLARPAAPRARGEAAGRS